MRTGSESRRPRGEALRDVEHGVGHAGVGRAFASDMASLHGASPNDGDIGRLFRDLRRCLQLSLPELARRLETHLDVIESLEAGDLSRLPPWPETVRVVSAFTMLAKIDPRPVLHLMHQRLESGGSVSQATVRTRTGGHGVAPRADAAVAEKPVASSEPPSPKVGAAPRSPLREGQTTWVDRLKDGLTLSRPALALGAGVVVVLVLLTSALPMGQQQASAAAGTGFLGRLVAGIQAYVSGPTVKEREGLRWIEVSDPRSRKGDKLHVSGH